MACVQVVAPQTTASPDSSSLVRVHNPWHIMWQSSDVPSLTPPPPQLECSTSILASWTPGATVGSTLFGGPCQETASHNSKGDIAGALFLMIGLPILIVALLVSCFGVWCHRRRKRRRTRTQSGGGPQSIRLTKVGSR